MATKIYTKDEAIGLLQKATGMAFSDEQLAILNNDFNTATLINACAGAGKTTNFILTILFNILTGRVDAKNVIGVTFSKKAQEDMLARYDNYVEKLNGINVDVYGIPYFSTFHALFYTLLKSLPAYRNVKVITDYNQFTFQLADALGDFNNELSKTEYLTLIFETYSYLMNAGLTLDGIVIRKFKKPIDEIELAEANDVIHAQKDKNFFENYVKVINRYTELKSENHCIDFTDMKNHILYIMRRNSATRDTILKKMMPYKLAIIDEFQDIDNVQAYLIKALLPVETYNRLIAIGDEDQNIYSFRGSNSEHILTFKDKMQNAKVLNLSTNYRTGGRILASASSVIERNIHRTDKELKAYNKDDGQILRFNQIDTRFDPKSLFLKKLVLTIQNKEQSTAVLVRFNIDRALVADWLAGQGFKPNINSEYAILQNNSFYQARVGLLKAIWYNDFNEFENEAKRIGFGTYESFVKEVANKSDKMISTVSEYLDEASNFSTRLRGFKLHQIHVANDNLKSVIDTVWAMRNDESRENDKDIVTFIWNSVSKLTKEYFDFMFKKHLMSKTNYEIINAYIWSEIKDFDDLDDFFVREERKSELLLRANHSNEDNNLEILSLHQAKGLEFDNVFLYGLTDNQISQDNLSLWHEFDANLTDQEFISQFKARISAMNLSRRGYKSLIKQITEHVNARLSTLLNLPHVNNAIFYSSDTLKDEKDKSINEAVKLLHAFAKQQADMIDEERRLLYVGMTRARHLLCVNTYGNSSSALLSEIDYSASGNDQIETQVASDDELDLASLEDIVPPADEELANANY